MNTTVPQDVPVFTTYLSDGSFSSDVAESKKFVFDRELMLSVDGLTFQAEDSVVFLPFPTTWIEFHQGTTKPLYEGVLMKDLGPGRILGVWVEKVSDENEAYLAPFVLHLDRKGKWNITDLSEGAVSDETLGHIHGCLAFGLMLINSPHTCVFEERKESKLRKALKTSSLQRSPASFVRLIVSPESLVRHIDDGHKTGIRMAQHGVRQHLWHLQSGRVVPVRAYTW